MAGSCRSPPLRSGRDLPATDDRQGELFESGRPGSNRRRPAWEAFAALAGQGFLGGGSGNGMTQYGYKVAIRLWPLLPQGPRGGRALSWLRGRESVGSGFLCQERRGDGDPTRRTQAFRGAGGGCRRLQPPGRHRRGGHARAATLHKAGADRSGHRGASRPHHQDHRRRHPGRVSERRRRRALRAGRAAPYGGAQCRDRCRPPHRPPDRNSPGRCRGRWRRPAGRRRQHRGAPGRHRGPGRHQSFGGCLAPGPRQAAGGLRRSGGAGAEKHRAPHASLSHRPGRRRGSACTSRYHCPTSLRSRCCRSRT